MTSNFEPLDDVGFPDDVKLELFFHWLIFPPPATLCEQVGATPRLMATKLSHLELAKRGGKCCSHVSVYEADVIVFPTLLQMRDR